MLDTRELGRFFVSMLSMSTLSPKAHFHYQVECWRSLYHKASWSGVESREDQKLVCQLYIKHLSLTMYLRDGCAVITSCDFSIRRMYVVVCMLLCDDRQ